MRIQHDHLFTVPLGDPRGNSGSGGRSNPSSERRRCVGDGLAGDLDPTEGSLREAFRLLRHQEVLRKEYRDHLLALPRAYDMQYVGS